MDKKVEIEKELERLQNELKNKAEKPVNERDGKKTMRIKWSIDGLQYILMEVEKHET